MIMNIANQSFPSFRTGDLNNALSALNTMHSGTSTTKCLSSWYYVARHNWSASSPTIKFFDGTDDISFATIHINCKAVNFN